MVACFFYLVSLSSAVVTCRCMCDLGSPDLVKLFPKEVLQGATIPGPDPSHEDPAPAQSKIPQTPLPPPRSRQPPRLPLQT